MPTVSSGPLSLFLQTHSAELNKYCILKIEQCRKKLTCLCADKHLYVHARKACASLCLVGTNKVKQTWSYLKLSELTRVLAQLDQNKRGIP